MAARPDDPPAAPMAAGARVLVLINSGAGTVSRLGEADVADRVGRGFAAQGVDARVVVAAGEELGRTLRAEGGAYDAVIAGGGDGTLNAVAAAVGAGGGVFGVLPLGTHNHFARELGVPLELDDAVAALARARVGSLPVAEVNGRIFLNFSGLGWHPLIVKHREAQRASRGRGKVLAMIVALWRTFRVLPLLRVRLRLAGGESTRVTPCVVVCTNAAQLELVGLPELSARGRRELHVFVARPRSKLGLLALALRAFLRRLRGARHFEVLPARAVELHLRARSVRVSLDGEVVDLEPPLRYRLRTPGLRVLVPEGAGVDEPFISSSDPER